MLGTAPLELGQLLHASTDTVREAAWEELIAKHTRLILAVARSFGGDSDEAMDRYAFVLEKLRESDFRRLRTFRDDRGARFSTWLTVASRRLCLDHHRSIYGRARESENRESDLLRNLRRQLADSFAGSQEVDELVDANESSIEIDTIILERDTILKHELDKLGSRERLILALRFENDLSASRIAEILGNTTQFSVYHQLNTLLSRLRVALELRGVENTDG